MELLIKFEDQSGCLLQRTVACS